MNDAMMTDLIRHTLHTAFILALPALGVTLVVGIAISIFQAATQINEVTLTFVPKMLAVGLTLTISAHWMLEKMVDYVHELYAIIPKLGG